MKVLKLISAAVPLLALTAFFCTGCDSRNEGVFILNRAPVLPPHDALYVIEGMGTFDIYLGMSRSGAEEFLGDPVSTNIGLYTYRRDEVNYTLKYADGVIVQIEIECDRFLSIRFAGSDIIYLTPYDATREEMEAQYQAPPDRDENLHWWYDRYGVGFIYDFNTQKITAIKIYPPAAPPYSLGPVSISDSVDADADGYFSAYRFNFDVNIPSGSDSIYVQLSARTPGSLAWFTPFFTSVNVYIESGADNSKWVDLTGGLQGTFDLKLDLFHAAGTWLDSGVIPGVKEESALQDAANAFLIRKTVYSSVSCNGCVPSADTAFFLEGQTGEQTILGLPFLELTVYTYKTEPEGIFEFADVEFDSAYYAYRYLSDSLILEGQPGAAEADTLIDFRDYPVDIASDTLTVKDTLIYGEARRMVRRTVSSLRAGGYTATWLSGVGLIHYKNLPGATAGAFTQYTTSLLSAKLDGMEY